MRRILLLAILLAASPTTIHAAGDPSRDVLWAALKTCVLAKKLAGRTFPCLDLDLGDKDRPGTAVLRAPGEPPHIVVMPTDTVAGLEAPALRGARGAAYWRAALAARRYVANPLKGRVPVAEVRLAVNSARGRSQDQLHIHLDCMKPRVLAALKARRHGIRGTWAPFPVPLAGDRYVALRVPVAEAEGFNPFAALARLPGRRDLRETSFAAVATPAGDPDPDSTSWPTGRRGRAPRASWITPVQLAVDQRPTRSAHLMQNEGKRDCPRPRFARTCPGERRAAASACGGAGPAYRDGGRRWRAASRYQGLASRAV